MDGTGTIRVLSRETNVHNVVDYHFNVDFEIQVLVKQIDDTSDRGQVDSVIAHILNTLSHGKCDIIFCYHIHALTSFTDIERVLSKLRANTPNCVVIAFSSRIVEPQLVRLISLNTKFIFIFSKPWMAQFSDLLSNNFINVSFHTERIVCHKKAIDQYCKRTVYNNARVDNTNQDMSVCNVQTAPIVHPNSNYKKLHNDVSIQSSTEISNHHAVISDSSVSSVIHSNLHDRSNCATSDALRLGNSSALVVPGGIEALQRNESYVGFISFICDRYRAITGGCDLIRFCKLKSALVTISSPFGTSALLDEILYIDSELLRFMLLAVGCPIAVVAERITLDLSFNLSITIILEPALSSSDGSFNLIIG